MPVGLRPAIPCLYLDRVRAGAGTKGDREAGRVELLWAIVTQTTLVLYEGSLYILLGFFVAGLLHEFLPAGIIARHLGRESPRSVLLAAVFGAPIPLCSCGVLPAVAALKRKGASRSALLSFAISTPETGVDSIALTYGLLGPLMAVVRPVVAIVSAMVAGTLSLFVRDEETVAGAVPAPAPAPAAHGHGYRHDHDHADDRTQAHHHGQGDPSCDATELDLEEESRGGPPGARLRRSLDFGFGTLFDEIAFWLVVGIALTGVLAALLPDDFFASVLGWDRGLLPMLVMALVGVPLYLCASASTPVAAALVAKGLSPGAALVFLLTGPATNAASIAVIGQILGRRRLAIFLLSIAGTSLAAGLLLDAFAADTVRAVARERFENPSSGWLGLVQGTAAVLFVGLLVRSFRRTRFREGRAEVRDQLARVAAALRGFELRSVLRPRVLVPLLVALGVWLGSGSYLVVEPGQRGIVQRFGKVVATDLEPGLHLHLPPPLGEGRAVDTALVRQVPIGFQTGSGRRRRARADDGYLLTADENLIDVRAVVHYRVDDPVRFALGVEDADALMQSLARRELVAIASATPIDALYGTRRGESEARVREALRSRVAQLDIGAEVLDVRLLDVHAPPDVHAAFRDVASALEDRQRAVHDARGYALERTAAASGEAAAITATARGDAVRARAVAEARTAAFAAVSAAHAASPEVTEMRLHLESLERALPRARKYVNAAGTGSSEVDLWLGAEPERSAASQGATPTGGGAGAVLNHPALRARQQQVR